MPSKRNYKKKRSIRRTIKDTAGNFVTAASNTVQGRYIKNKSLRLDKIAQDVAMLMAAVNSEKKQYKLSGTLIRLGQTIGNLNGSYAFDVTPIPAQGTTSETRNGNSIKLHSSYYRFQISQNSATTNPIKFKIRLDLVRGAVQTAGNWLSVIKDPNPFVTGTITDYNSNDNIDAMNLYTTIFERKYVIKQDSISGGNQVLNIDIPIKYFYGKGTHVKFTTDGAQTVTTGQLIMSIVLDNGNGSASSVNNSVTGVPLNSTAIETGLFMSYNMIHYFYDN